MQSMGEGRKRTLVWEAHSQLLLGVAVKILVQDAAFIAIATAA